MRAHEFPPTVIRFNPSATLLVSGSADNTIRTVAIPETLTGTSAYVRYTFELLLTILSAWTTGSVFFLTVLVLLLAVLISYLYTDGFLD